MLTDCCGEEEEAAVSLFQPLGEASKLGHCLSFPQRANAPAEGTQENTYVRRKKPRADGSGGQGMDGASKAPDLAPASLALSRVSSDYSNVRLDSHRTARCDGIILWATAYSVSLFLLHSLDYPT